MYKISINIYDVEMIIFKKQTEIYVECFYLVIFMGLYEFLLFI